MNRTLRTIVAAILVLVIAFSAISISQNIGKRLKLDITDQRLYSLSDGTKAILAKLHQPIKAKLYYAKTAALKGPDQIRYFNNYYEFVRALLEEYVTASNGMFELEVIDPRPFSGDETEALRLGLRRFPITQEENFFFGLVVQTPFGVEKAIPFFSPDRQKFVEYDISYLVDTAITRQKKRIGIMSSLPVMGDDASGYMAQMKRMQGQPLAPPWTIVEVLRRKYDVKQVDTDMDVNDVNDVDILLVVHPKDLPEKTQFAIDQYVLKGGKTIVFVDPHCIADQPDRRAMQMGTPPSQSSNLDGLMRTWGLEMPAGTFAGDRDLALAAPVVRNQRPEKIIGYLRLRPGCFNEDNVISAELNDLRLLFAGVIREIAEPNEQAQGEETAAGKIRRTPLLMTTNRGNSWKVTSPYELMMLDPSRLMAKFLEGTEPVSMGYLVTGRFKSAFPDGIEIEVEVEDDSDEAGDPNETKTIKKQIKGLTEAEADCAVVVFADADVISDMLAYQDSLFGPLVVADNAALLLNTIDDLSGSSDLVSIRSRGNFKRPFTVVDEIRQDAEEDTAAEVTKLNAQIQGYNTELQSIVSSAKEGEEDVIGSTIVEKKRDLQLKIREAERQLNEVKLKRRERIEHLGNTLRQANMLLAPAVILVIAILLGIRRTVRKRHYISHASDA
ncbi:MAG: Gldg family protein [Phycisphaerales bacterium]|nr:MAG: Gldg family protein [Phycisphaerales bacterium]